MFSHETQSSYLCAGISLQRLLAEHGEIQLSALGYGEFHVAATFMICMFWL